MVDGITLTRGFSRLSVSELQWSLCSTKRYSKDKNDRSSSKGIKLSTQYSVEYRYQPWDVIFVYSNNKFTLHMYTFCNLYWQYYSPLSNVQCRIITYGFCVHIYMERSLQCTGLHPCKKHPCLRLYGSYQKLLT